MQDRDLGMVTREELKVVTKLQPTEEQWQDLLFAWKVAKFAKSNAIVYAHQGQTVGIGAGQMSRVNSARIAAIKAEDAGLEVKGSVMASDAFFPFRDGIDAAAAAGIAAVIDCRLGFGLMSSSRSFVLPDSSTTARTSRSIPSSTAIVSC